MYTDFPAVKYDNVVNLGSEIGTIIFQFRHTVIEASVTWSSDNGACDSMLSGMNVMVTCSDLTNDVDYTVTIQGILDVNQQQLPFIFSQLVTPVEPPLPTTISDHG